MSDSSPTKELRRRLERLRERRLELFFSLSESRMRLDREGQREAWRRMEENEEEIKRVYYEFGKTYEEQAKCAESDTEKLSLLLIAVKFFDESSYQESLRLLRLAKDISVSSKRQKIQKLCEAKIVYTECKILDEEAEDLWHNCLELGEKGEIDESDPRWARLGLLRDTITGKMKQGLKYAEEADSPDLQISFLGMLTWSLYRRLDRSKFADEISTYRKRAALIYESLAMRSITADPALSIQNLLTAADEYRSARLYDDEGRVYQTILDLFKERLSKETLFRIRWNMSRSADDFKSLAEEMEAEGADEETILNVLARQFELKAQEDPDDLESYFKAGECNEKLHRRKYKDLETGHSLGDSYFLKGLGYARLAASEGLSSKAGRVHLQKAIESIQRSTEVSDWAFREPIYLSIYKTIYEMMNLPREKMDRAAIGKRLRIAKFLSWEYDVSSEKSIAENMELLIESVFEKDNVSAIKHLKNIEADIGKIECDLRDFVREIIPIVAWDKIRAAELPESIRRPLEKTDSREAWERCKYERDRGEKGRLLEGFITKLFATIEGLALVKRNLVTANEELDIVFRNNVDRPFWMSLDSPHIVVECKNWSSKVQAEVVRSFEMKMINHFNLARIGVFVATNGYESGCSVEQVRGGRDRNIIVLISGDDIDSFLESAQNTIEWLEQSISSSMR